MNNKDFKRHFAYEALIFLGILALFFFVCRLWPIFLLVILGIFAVELRLLFFSSKNMEKIGIIPQLEQEPKQVQPTEKTVHDLTYVTIQKRITEMVNADYPNARWVWETPDAKSGISEGRPVYILLNRAGGYRRALVVIENFTIRELAYQRAEPDLTEKPEDDNFIRESLLLDTEEQSNSKLENNYEYLAFEWVDAHVIALNERCNEGIAQGLTSVLVETNILPERQSWTAICRELDRNGIEDCEITKDGIMIHFTQ